MNVLYHWGRPAAAAIKTTCDTLVISQDFHLLLSRLATSKARMVSQNEGRPISDNERGLILNQLRRRLAVTIIKSQSNCLLSRLAHMSPGAKEAAQRRAVAKQRQSALEKDTIAHFEALVRRRRLWSAPLIVANNTCF